MATRRALARACAAIATLLLVPDALPAGEAAHDAATFRGPLLRQMLAFGPWPPAIRTDPSNRLSGDPFAIDFGRRLFFDSMLSSNGYVACASCHQPDRGWTDLRARAQALGPSRRNTPPVENLGLQRWWGWAGASDSLWMATLRPLLDPDEMNSNPRLVARRLSLNADLGCRYRRLFGPLGDRPDDAVMVNLAKAMAAFQETLVTGRTPFDDFRDALAAGKTWATGRYPAAAKRGLALFVGKAQCSRCHSGPAFSDGRFHVTGVAMGIAWAEPDPGRVDGLRRLRTSGFTLRGAHNDDPARALPPALPAPVDDGLLRGAFRTPGLRNVAVTAPYMHDGSLDTLEAVVARYAQIGPRVPADSGKAELRVPTLNGREIADLAAFLHTLTDERGASRMPEAAAPPACD
ncbi:cytochrome-c peroxidase [Piscinibacter sakaiensis]|uniref:cytochrome-c peroxidase n=1 Tax=Piscinibacter sakaiensis TaxID=1547922 RepID=UPI003AAF2BF3